MLFIAIKEEHYEHSQLLGNYYVIGLYSVITSTGLQSHSGLVKCNVWGFDMEECHKAKWPVSHCGGLWWAEAVRVCNRGDESHRVLEGQGKMYPVLKGAFQLPIWAGTAAGSILLHNNTTTPRPTTPLAKRQLCAAQTRLHTSSFRLVSEPREGRCRGVTSS